MPARKPQTAAAADAALFSDVAAARTALAEWFAAHQRAMPWRDEPTRYHVVLSEFMLQQTQVATVIPYFERFRAQFPDFAALAAADEEAVVKAWEGLGYYSRARNLRRLAQALVALEDPPRTAAEWQALPGIGPYTSAAIASIVYGDPVAVVDGNVVRVMARLRGDEMVFASSQAAVEQLRPTAQTFLDPENPGNHNQAVMELGATVCRKGSPLCTVCPLVRWCVAGRRGDAEALPRLQRAARRQREVARAWLYDGNHLLLATTAPDGRRLQGFCELPTLAQTGARATAKNLLVRKRRGIGNDDISEPIYRVALTANRRQQIETTPELRWVAVSDLDTITLSGPHRRWIGELLAAEV